MICHKTFSFCSKTSEDVWSVGSCKDSSKDTLPSPSSEPSDEDSIGRPEIYWRLVRPNKLNDVGPLHADSWFWNLNNKKKDKRFKLWVPIHCEINNTGFRYVPNSHVKKWKYVGASDLSSDVIFISNEKKFLEKLTNSNKIYITVNLYQDGQNTFVFDSKGLKKEFI